MVMVMVLNSACTGTGPLPRIERASASGKPSNRGQRSCCAIRRKHQSMCYIRTSPYRRWLAIGYVGSVRVTRWVSMSLSRRRPLPSLINCCVARYPDCGTHCNVHLCPIFVRVLLCVVAVVVRVRCALRDSSQSRPLCSRLWWSADRPGTWIGRPLTNPQMSLSSPSSVPQVHMHSFLHCHIQFDHV